MGKIRVTRLSQGDIVVLEPRGRLVGGEETEELQQTIHKLVEEGNKRLIVDLGKVLYLNSTALGLLVSTHANYTRRGGKIKLCNIASKIENIFVITKLTLVFEVYDNQMEAIASFAS
jgi:anti-sigma B factor antagonist